MIMNFFILFCLRFVLHSKREVCTITQFTCTIYILLLKDNSNTFSSGALIIIFHLKSHIFHSVNSAVDIK